MVIDPVINLRGSNNVTATFVVEARSSFAPRDAQLLMAGLSRPLRSLAGLPVLVVAPWLSARAQELLRTEEVSYIDLTGNAWVRAAHPPLFISSTGAARNPQPVSRAPVRLRGAKAGRLVRALVDITPPYGVGDLARTTGLNPGYVSRLLEALDREALVDRAGRGVVTAVDYLALVARWTETYRLFDSNAVSRYIAADGAAKVLAGLRSAGLPGRVVVTGSFAAVRQAPVAAPVLLAAYAQEPAALAGALGLLPADEGANVILLGPFDPVVWERTEADDAITYAAPSQVAADCLTGAGRMPAEGQALLAWMGENEDRWRAASLAALTPDASR